MHRIIFFTVLLPFLFFISPYLFAKEKSGHKITVKVDNLKDSVCYLGFYYGDKKYLQDTASRNDDGFFVFEGLEPLEGGVYFVYNPKNLYFEIIVNEQQFDIETDTKDPVQTMVITGSRENQVFHQLQKFGIERQKQMTALKEQIEIHKANVDSVKELQYQLEQINNELLNYRKKLISENPNLFVAEVIKASEVIEIPETVGKGEETTESNKSKYQYYKKHFLDNINFTDARMLKTPVFHNKLMEYFDKVIIQHPDSIFAAATEVLTQAEPAEEMFRYVLTTLASKYETSNIMGMEEVFIKLAEKYYLNGKAFWVDEEVKNKIKDKVEENKPTMIGKQAPPMMLTDTLNHPVNLYAIEAKYLILYFYDPTCGNCKKKTPIVYETYKNLKNKGVKVLGVSTITDADEWKKYIKTNKLDWLNAGDPAVRSNFRYDYNIDSVPKVYILDENKKIIARRLGAEDIEPFLKNLIKTN